MGKGGGEAERRLTGGDVGGGVGVGQARHLAGQAGLAGPAVEAQVRDPRRGGQGVLAVHADVRVMSVGCGGERKGNGERASVKFCTTKTDEQDSNTGN